MSYSVKKAGVAFKLKIDLGPDTSGEEGNFTLSYFLDGTNTDLDAGTTFVESTAVTGLYFSSDIIVASPGDYTFNILHTGNGNVAVPVIITSNSMQDIYDAVDTVSTAVAAIKTQVDVLDEAELNTISESVLEVQTTVETVRDLINNKTATITYTGADEAAQLIEGTLVTGVTSGAIGTIKTSTLTGDTVILLTGVVGEFDVGEELTSVSGTTTNGISIVTYGKTTVDSTLEFLSQINAALTDGSTGLSALEGFTDDIENLLTGTEFLQDGSTPNPFYDATNTGVAKEATVVAALGTLQNQITSAKNSIETKMDTLIGADTDTSGDTTLFGKIAAAQAAIDGNNTILTSGVYGNEQLRAAMTSLETDLTAAQGDITSVKGILEDATFGLSALKTRFDTVDGTLASIEGKVDGLVSSGPNTAKVFV